MVLVGRAKSTRQLKVLIGAAFGSFLLCLFTLSWPVTYRRVQLVEDGYFNDTTYFDSRNVYVVIAGDHSQHKGLFASANSVLMNSNDPGRIRLLLLISPGRKTEMEKLAVCYWGDELASQATFIEFDEKHIGAPVKVVANVDVYGNLAAPLNFARYYLYSLPEQIEKVVYLDADTIVMADVFNLYNSTIFPNNEGVAAVPRPKTPVSQHLNFDVRAVKKACNPEDPSFNAGVLVMNLKEWRRSNIFAQLERWMAMNAKAPKKKKLYKLGSNPPLLLTMCHRFAYLDARWNANGYGWTTPKLEQTRAAFILHWTGVQKPWQADGRNKKYWRPFHKKSCFPDENAEE